MWTGLDWAEVGKLTTWAMTTFVASWGGAFFGAYLKKKGENKAIHEDIDKLVDQVRAVTTTTKQIEAQISGDLWDRQKRWELRRDALFELGKRLGLLKDSLTLLISVHQTDFEHGWQNDVNRTQNRLKAGQEWLDAAAAIDNAILMAGMVCDKNLYQSLLQFSLTTRQIGAKTKEWDAGILAKGTATLGKELAVVMEALRKELDRVSELRLRSNESSAAPNPG